MATTSQRKGIRVNDSKDGFEPTPDGQAPWPAHPVVGVANAIPYARPVVPVPTGPGVTDLLMGVGLVWAIELTLGFGAGVIAVFYGVAKGDSPFDVMNDFGSIAWLMLPTVLLSNCCAVIICWYFMCKRHGRSPADGLALGKPPMRSVVLAFLIAVLVVAFFYGLPEAGSTSDTDVPILQLMQGGGIGLFALFAVFVAPMEEIYYRGFIYPMLRRYVGPVGAIFIVSIWFTGIHAFQLIGALSALVPIFMMALIWTCMREFTGSLWPSIVCHMTYNAGLMLINLME